MNRDNLPEFSSSKINPQADALSNRLDMATASTPEHVISSAVLAQPDHDSRVRLAIELLSYALGTVAALEGSARAAQVAYRCADALATKP